MLHGGVVRFGGVELHGGEAAEARCDGGEHGATGGGAVDEGGGGDDAGGGERDCCVVVSAGEVVEGAVVPVLVGMAAVCGGARWSKCDAVGLGEPAGEHCVQSAPIRTCCCRSDRI